MVEGTIQDPATPSAAPGPAEPRRRGRHRRHGRHRRSRRGGYERSLVNFSTLQISVGVLAACLQMVHFTNNSILSQSQPGLWCGTFFVITGAVCLALSRTRGVYSTLVMLAFCLVSLFMALTLSSLSWLGSEASIMCQETYDSCRNTTIVVPYHDTDDTSIPFSDFDRKEECDGDGDGKFTCADLLESHCCGYNVGLSRTIHSLLMLMGIVEATTSFILAAVACSRSSEPAHHRYPSITLLAAEANDQVSSHVRPITAWDYPAPDKRRIFTVESGVADDSLPDEPPPPYEAGHDVAEIGRF